MLYKKLDSLVINAFVILMENSMICHLISKILSRAHERFRLSLSLCCEILDTKMKQFIRELSC